jgi:fructose-1,6-bisphosphatase I
MSFVIEKAGGKSITDGGKSILEIEPEDIHQRKPIYLGSVEDVEQMAKRL